jgi:propionyl-CoA carboxylase alpha chain
MFKKILIANRGEIACRVMKTAKRLGIKTVAVYSDADRSAPHVEMADEAVHIGPPPAAQSYLIIEKIVEACKATGAEAVHPGYGFLSEREAFPVALAKAGVTFIGPNPKAIAAMGDKIESKKAAAAAKVSTVPGYLGIIEDAKHAAKIADEIGYPVMIKASAGGGGKGMRIAHSKAEVQEGFDRAKSEAKSSFGDDRVFVEKFIVDPRHIEIQVLGDKHGTVIYLGERECSVQRRNQKVIEEAPSPLLDETTRKKMGEQAVALAKAVGYDSAGTVEFVAGQDKSFYFLEMNTRLQVEHPVTELITGIDLVEQMLRVAAGEKLGISQKDVKLKGWALESRVYAEDPYKGFVPSIGRLTRYRPPTETVEKGITVRVDTGVEEGSEISMFYDPMIAKLCTHGPSREDAIHAMADALDAFELDGIRHNIPFLNAIVTHPRFGSGKLSTGFIAAALEAGAREKLVGLAAYFTAVSDARAHSISGTLDERAAKAAWPSNWVVDFGGESYPVRCGNPFASSSLFDIEIGPFENGHPRKTVAVAMTWQPGSPLYQGAVNGDLMSVQLVRVSGGFRLTHRGATLTAFVRSPRAAEFARLMPEKKAADTSKSLLCPMPGLIVSIEVKEGDEVKAGQTLAVVEAMKMENVLKAERDVTVGKIKAKKGDTLAVDDVILEFA